MPSYICRPVSDDKFEWRASTGSTGWDLIDESVIQPTAPSVGTDFVVTQLSGKILRPNMADISLAAGENVTELRCWYYAGTPLGATLTASFTAGSISGSETMPADTAPSWRNFVASSGTLSETNVNATRFLAQPDASSTPPTFVSAGAVSIGASTAANPTNLVPGVPSSLEEDDLLLIFTWCRSITATVSTPTGYTLLSGFPKRSGTASGGSWYVFAKVSDGSDSGTVSVSWSGVTTGASGDHCQARIVAYRNVLVQQGAANVLDGAATVNDQAASTTTATIPSITTNNDNSRVIGAVVKIQDLAGTWTPPTSWTERIDNGSTNASGGYWTIVDKNTTGTAGASGTATATPVNATSTRALGIAIALKADVCEVEAVYFEVTTTVPVDSSAQTLLWDANTETNSASQTLLWDANTETNSASQTLVWDTLVASVPVDSPVQDLLWDTAAAVDSSVQDLLWDTFAQVSKANILLWDALALTNSSVQDLLWDTVAQVNSGIQDLIWDAYSSSDSVLQDLLWDAFSVTNSSIQDLLWDTLIASNSAVQDILWDALVGSDSTVQDLLWDTAAASNSSVQDLLWDAFGATDSSIQDLLWDELITADSAVQDLLWDTAAAVSAQAILFWDLIAQVAAQRTLVWDEIAQVAAQRILLWDEFIEVSSQRTLLWDVIAQVASPYSLLWDTRAAANSAAKILLWDTVAQVLNSRILLWDLDGVIPVFPVDSDEQDLLWDTFALSNSSVQDLLWDTNAAVSASGIFLWDIRIPADSTAQDLLWDARALVNSAVQDLLWDIAKASNSAGRNLLWKLYAETDSGSKTLLWDIIEVLAIVAVTSGPEPNEISKQPDKRTSTFIWEADRDFAEYKIKVVTNPTDAHTAGTTIPTSNGSTNMSGSAGGYSAESEITSTIDGADLEAASAGDGNKRIKIFVKNESGDWSINP